MADRFELMTNVKAAEREFLAMSIAATNLIKALRDASIAMPEDLKFRDIDAAASGLQGTYVVRLFSEYETGLRGYWDAIGRRTTPRAVDLIDSIGGRRTIPSSHIENAHRVRKYRNSLVHESDDEVEVISVGDARSFLCHYMSFLPLTW